MTTCGRFAAWPIEVLLRTATIYQTHSEDLRRHKSFGPGLARNSDRQTHLFEHWTRNSRQIDC